jgi:hypothetical protein
LSNRGGHVVNAHRAAYELLVGPVPDGHDLHHRPSLSEELRQPRAPNALSHADHARLGERWANAAPPRRAYGGT